MTKKIKKIYKTCDDLFEYVHKDKKATLTQTDLDLLMDSYILLEETYSQLEDRVVLSNN